MIEFKHTGIYVKDINKLASFYSQVFNMKIVSNKSKETNPVIDELLGLKNSVIVTTKLITEKGSFTKSGDMLELIAVPNINNNSIHDKIFRFGMMHIALKVDDILSSSRKLVEMGGVMRTQIYTFDNGNKFGFATDPEGNWIEMIQNKL